MKTLLLSFIVLLGLALVAGQSHARPAPKQVTYDFPKVDGIALDWCKTLGKKCGKPAANYFCRAKGHKRAIHFVKRNNIGFTKTLKSKEICRENSCDSFRTIKCQTKIAHPPITPVKRFHLPKYRGIALDWCFTWGKNCGKVPADTYCLSKGFTKGAIRFQKQNNIGYTRIFQTGRICNNASCDGYKFIDCQR